MTATGDSYSGASAGESSYPSSEDRNECMVSLVSRRYIRGENGTESLMVC